MKLQAGAFAKHQRGGFAMGLIVGLLIGLALALGVALYIAKVPSPFHDKVPHRSPEQDAAEAEKLKNWDPNAGLGGKPVTRQTAMRPPSLPASRCPGSGRRPQPAPVPSPSSTTSRLAPSRARTTPNNSAPSWRYRALPPRSPSANKAAAPSTG